MTSFHKLINLIFAAIVLTIGMSLTACTEKSDVGGSSDKEGAENSSVTITFDMSDPMQRQAAGGDVEALYDLAYRYQDGKGVPKDEVKALELFRRAAKHDDTPVKRH